MDQQLFTTDAFQRGHRNWAERPDDEGFDKIEPLIAKLEHRFARSQEGTINLKAVARDGDIIANGIVEAAKDVALFVPMVVRLEGTKVEEGRKILSRSGLPIISASDLDDAAQKIVKAVKA